MMKLKDFIKNIIFFILPMSYILYILYIRVILVRDVRILYIPLSYTQIIIILIIMIGLLLRIYALLKKENALNENVNQNRFLLWLKNSLNPILNYINEMWKEFYHQFTRRSLKLNLLILKLVKIMFNRLTLVNGLIIISLFEILPKVILVTAFLIDVFFFQQFYYFYKFVFLLLLPLIYITVRSILLEFYVDNFEELRSFMDITVDDAETELTYKFKNDVEPPDYINGIKDFMENHYIPVAYIPNLVLHFDSIKVRYKINWFFIAILALHLIGWFTILFVGIYV